MKKYINLALAIIAGAALTGCDDFLNDNRYPLTSIVDSPAYWSNTNNVQLQCDRFIDEFSQGYGSGAGQDGWFYFKNLNDDQVASSFAEWTYTTVPGTNGAWDYGVIRGANIVIKGVERSSLKESEKANFLGIARFVRGYRYYHLVRMYGDVVWEDHVPDVNDQEILYGPRTDRDQVMDYVIEDLQFALANIAAESSKTTWSKDYVRAVLSEVGLYEGTFCKYRTQADNGKGPDLERAKKMLELSAKMSDELLAKYEFCDDYQSIYNSTWDAMDGIDGTKITALSSNPELIFGRRYDAVNGLNSLISFTASSTTTSGLSLDGFNAFLFKDGKPKATTSCNTSMVGVPDADNNTLCIQNLLDEREARLSVITDPYVYYKGMEWSRAGCSGMNSSSGFGVAKYDNVKLPVAARTNSAQNYTSAPIYWTSYIALNYAEAKAELADSKAGSFTDADFNKSLKKIYERAGLSMINSVAAMEAINDPANNMGVSGLLWELRRCRRCELMFDNWIRYWDLIRWHQLELLDSQKHPDILRGAYAANAPTAPMSIDAEGYVRPYSSTNRVYNYKYYLYPIPSNQINLNQELGQNPGWGN